MNPIEIESFNKRLDASEILDVKIGPEGFPEGTVIETILTNELPPESITSAVFGFIFYKDKVLFTKGESDHSHRVEIPGGHIEKTESFEEALIRELTEETGVTPEKIKYVGVLRYTVPPQDASYKYPSPVSYSALYVTVVSSEKQPNKDGVWMSLKDARENSWVKEFPFMFETMYLESNTLSGMYHKTFLETYTIDGSPTHVTESYNVVHRKGLWHRAVHVWLCNSNKQFLVQKRSRFLHTTPGQYECTAGGHIDAGHTSIETALHELHEEVGLEVSPNDLEFVGTIIDQFEMYGGATKNNEFDDVYIVWKDVQIDDLKINPNEVELLEWFDAMEYLQRGINDDPAIVHRPKEYHLLYTYLKNNTIFNEN